MIKGVFKTTNITIMAFRSRKTILYSMVIFVLIIGIFLSGCTKKETTAETKAIRCQIFDAYPDDIAQPSEVNFGGSVLYLGTTREKIVGNQLKISYYWQLKQDLGRYKQIFVHFTDINNNLLFQNDHEFCAKRSFEELKGKFIKDTCLVGIPETAKGKEIGIKIGLYVPEGNNPRIKIESAGKAPVDENNTRALVDRISLQ